MYVLKGERLGEMQNISHANLIYVTNIISKERVKVWMGNPKVLLQVLLERVFINTSKYVCNYYTLRGREGNYDNTIIETSLRELVLNCLDFIY